MKVMKKVLIISVIGLGFEGITSVIYNYSSHMSLTQISLDFAAPDDINKQTKNKFQAIGNLYELSSRCDNIIQYIRDLGALIRKNRYDVVHIHGNSGTMLIEAAIAKFYGVPKILTHCHSTKCDHPFLNLFMAPVMKALATDYLACADGAGQFLYGKSSFTVLNNAIDVEKFKYRESVRDVYREKLNLHNFNVIGHVGHFTEPKNHNFLIDVFAKCEPAKNHLKLVLISDGPYYNKIKEKVSQLNLNDYVIFLGRRSDIAEIYQAMDLFILPSNWEGLPLVMIEAQAAGLPMLVSDAITREAKCAERVQYRPLVDGPEKWAENVLFFFSEKLDREKYSEQSIEKIREHGFDIVREAEKIRKIYLS